MYRLSHIALFLLSASLVSTEIFGQSVTRSNANDVLTSDNNDRRLFQPLQSRDLSNILLDNKRNIVYVGAVNFLYALDADDITIKKGEIHWAPEPSKLQTCINFKGDAIRCQNSIRVLHSVNDSFIFACGTMAFTSTCIYVNKKDFTRAPGHAENGKWRSPDNPSSFTVSTMSGDALFTATTPSSPNKNGVISKTVGEGTPLRTNDNDDFWLSDPQFVSAFTVPEGDNQEKVIVLLKENAEEIPVEVLTQENDHSLSVVYSRLVSICANDRGGNLWILKNKFATFTKMRISCPVEIRRGKTRRTIPFFYDEIQSTFVLENPKEPSNPTIYAIFTTPRGAFEATATCVFEMNDIRRYLSTNKHWNRPGKSAAFFSTYDGARGVSPGTCVRDSTVLSAQRLSYGNEHPIKYGIIKPKEGYAVYQDTGITFTHIVIDRINRKEKLGSELVERRYDVVHYITASGFMKRVVFFADDRSKFWEIPSRNIYHGNETEHAILTVKINDGYLYLGTNASLIQLRVAACSSYETCAACSLANDPYCDWSEVNNTCEKIDFDLPVKRPTLLFKRLNETKCTGGGDINADKKSGDVDDIHEEDIEADVESRKVVEARLSEFIRRQNESIVTLRTKNNFLATKLSESMDELSNLMKNYTQLSALLLQYDARRKLVIQLYRNTVFSLHACQHEKNQRNTAERKAALEANNRRGYSNRTSTNCGNSGDASYSSSLCSCEKEGEYQRMVIGMRERDKTHSRQKITYTQSLEACHSNTAELKQQVLTIGSANSNMTDERNHLERQINKLHKENQKLRIEIGNAEQKSISCAESQWSVYAPTATKFLLTREAANFVRARNICARNGGVIAQVKTPEEMSYIYNVTKTLGTRRRYWIGLQKQINGTMLWSDGTTFDPSEDRRFPKSQNGKLSNSVIYCVETTHREHEWQLISCAKSRRVMCSKEYGGNVR